MLKYWPGILNTPLPPISMLGNQTDSNTIVDAARDAAASDRSTLRWGERGALLGLKRAHLDIASRNIYVELATLKFGGGVREAVCGKGYGGHRNSEIRGRGAENLLKNHRIK